MKQLKPKKGVVLSRERSASRKVDKKRNNVFLSKHMKPIEVNEKPLLCPICKTQNVYWERRYLRYDRYGELMGKSSAILEVLRLCDTCKILEPLPKRVRLNY